MEDNEPATNTMLNGESSSQNPANAPDDDVSHSEEVIFATHPRCGRQDYSLFSAKACHGIILRSESKRNRNRRTISNYKFIIPSERAFDNPPKLSERRKASCTHPVHEIGILKVVDSTNTGGTLRVRSKY